MTEAPRRSSRGQSTLLSRVLAPNMLHLQLRHICAPRRLRQSTVTMRQGTATARRPVAKFMVASAAPACATCECRIHKANIMPEHKLRLLNLHATGRTNALNCIDSAARREKCMPKPQSRGSVFAFTHNTTILSTARKEKYMSDSQCLVDHIGAFSTLHDQSLGQGSSCLLFNVVKLLLCMHFLLNCTLISRCISTHYCYALNLGIMSIKKQNTFRTTTIQSCLDKVLIANRSLHL